MNRNKSFVLKIIHYYLITGVIEAFISLVYLFNIPSDPKNVWIFGISKYRFVMSIGIIIVILGFLFLTIITYRKQNSPRLEKIISRLEKWIRIYGWFIPFIVLAFGLVVFGPYLYMLKNSTDLPTLHAKLIRVGPFILLGCTRTLQTVFVLIILNFHLKPRYASQTEDKQIVAINPRKVMIILLIIGLLLATASIVMDITEQIIWQRIDIVAEKFDLDHEYNIPTWFSSLLLLISSALSWLIAKLNPLGKKPNSYKTHWIGLSVLFLLLSMDEVAVLHEHLSALLKKVIVNTNLFDRGWVIAALPFLFLFVVFYLRFFLQLPKDSKLLLLLAGSLYLGGAIGVEFLNGWYEDLYNDDRLATYQVLTTIEESLEMAGIMVYIYTILKYLSANTNEIIFRLRSHSKLKAGSGNSNN